VDERNVWKKYCKKNENEKLNGEIFIIGTVSLAICGKNNTLKNIINELKKKVERNYPDFKIVEEHTIGIAEQDNIGEHKILSNIFKGKCVVLVKGICEDLDLSVFFRLAPKH